MQHIFRDFGEISDRIPPQPLEHVALIPQRLGNSLGGVRVGSSWVEVEGVNRPDGRYLVTHSIEFAASALIETSGR